MFKFKFFSLLFLLISFNLPSAELAVTEDSVESLIQNFMKDSADIGIDLDLLVSTKKITGTRDRFRIDNLRVYDSSPQNILTIKEISCDGHKVNDHDFQTSLSNKFKVPPLSDLKKLNNNPNKCSIKRMNLIYLINLFTEEFMNTLPDSESRISADSINTTFDLFKDIDLEISTKVKRNKQNTEIKINLSDSIFTKTTMNLSQDVEEIHTFINTLINNVVFNYWGYDSYESLYADTSGDTSDIYNDFLAEIAFQPTVFIEHVPDMPKILLNETTLSVAWTDDQYDYYKKNNPEIEGLILMLQALTVSSMNRNEFISMLSSNEKLAPLVLFQDILFPIYVSAFRAGKEFVKDPNGMKVILSFDEGINLAPDIRLALENPEYFDTFFYSLLIYMMGSLELKFEANPDIY